MTIKVLLVAEIEIEGDSLTQNEPAIQEYRAQQKLDAFRETTLPGDYGIFLYRAPQELNREEYI
jgi:hypothetical protein